MSDSRPRPRRDPGPPRGQRPSLAGAHFRSGQPGPDFSSIVAISSSTGISELAVNEVPPAQSGDDWIAFCTSLAGWMNEYVPRNSWADQPPDCVLLDDTASVQSPVADEILTLNSVLLRHLPPYSPNLSFIELKFAEYKRNVRDLSYHHPELPDRLMQVLAFGSTPLVSIQGHYREARRKLWRHLPEMTGPRRPFQVVLPALPVELAPPQL